MRGSHLGEKARDNWIACGQALRGRAKRNPVHRRTRGPRRRRRAVAAGVAFAYRGNRVRRIGAGEAYAPSSGHYQATLAQESAGHMTRVSHFRSLMLGRQPAGGRHRRAVMAGPITKSIAVDLESPERPGTSRRAPHARTRIGAWSRNAAIASTAAAYIARKANSLT